MLDTPARPVFLPLSLRLSTSTLSVVILLVRPNSFHVAVSPNANLHASQVDLLWLPYLTCDEPTLEGDAIHADLFCCV